MKVLIVEDEAPAARRLQKQILEIEPKAEILAVLDSIEGFTKWWTHNTLAVDLLFLDIHLADGSSFEIFDRFTIENFVVFTTAYDEYALEAFKVNAVDYLLKPIKKDELANSIERFKKRAPVPVPNYKELNRRFLIRMGQNLKMVKMEQVAYFQSENKITILTSKEGKRYPIDYSLDKLEAILPPDKFFKVNRQFIVCIDAIDKMTAYSKSRVKIELLPTCSEDIIVSTDKSPVFKKWLTGEDPFG